METICVKVTGESDIFDRYDPEKRCLSEEFTEYIKKRFAACGKDRKAKLKIVSESPIDEEKLKNAFRQMYDDEISKLKQEKRFNVIKQIWMFTVGCLFILLSLFSDRGFGKLVTLIFSTIGSFAMWEAAAIWIVQNPVNRYKQMTLARLDKRELTLEIVYVQNADS